MSRLSDSPLSVPTIHLNGSSRDTLKNDLIGVLDKLREAQEALQQAHPNGRDYYPQSPTAIVMATAQWKRRNGKIQEIIDHIGEELEAIDQQGESPAQGGYRKLIG